MSAMPSIIAPSLLSGDFANLAHESRRMIDAGADWLHIDVMDGHFVPNLTIGAPVVKSLRKNLPSAYLDCHLMVTDPLKWLADFEDAGASGFTFHIEAIAPELLEEAITQVKQTKMKVGVAIKPKTPIDALVSHLEKGQIDLVTIMTVEPGFGGQKFMEDQMGKVRALRNQFPSLSIQVDGGLNSETVKLAAAAGANVIVAGSSVFSASDAGHAISDLRRPFS